MNIRQKFILLLLQIGVLPMLVVSVVAYASISNSLLAKTTEQLNSTAVKQEQKITTFLQTRREEATKLANQYDLLVALRQYLASPSAGNKDALTLILQNKKIAVPSIQSVFLSDLEGKLLVSSSADTGQNIKDIEVPSSSGETTMTIRTDTQDGFSKLYITTLVSINKQKAALLNVVFRTDDIIASVQDYTGLGETGETVVISKDNLSLFPLRFNTDATLKTNLSSLNLFNIANTSYQEAVDYRGKTVLIVAHPAGLSDWVVATKIDKEEALESTIFLRNSMIAIVVVASVLIIAIALFFTRLFTRPILAIARASERIGLGDFTAHAEVRQRDEIGALANSVNAMGNNLKEMVGNIESQRRRLQIVLDSTTETIFAIDEQSTIILVNRAILGLLQQPPKEFVGKNLGEVFTWKHGMQDFSIDYTTPGVHTYSNLQYTDLLGVKRYVKVIVSRVADEVASGRTHAIVTIHDETSSHELDNMKTDFVSMAAHELRTPLTAVRGYLEMIQYKQEHNDPADVPAYLRQALKNVGDLGGLINNLLDVTRIERGTLTLNMEKVDIAADIDRTVKDLMFIAEDREIKLSYEGRDKDVFVVGDEIALREIMNNLLANAIKYTKPGGSVKVTLVRGDDACIVSVADTGIGIPKEAIPRLFTKFYRVNGGLDSGSSGTGLGLFIAKSIVERHHGTIGVTSKEGEGSTFSFTLPLFTEYRLANARPHDDSNDTTVRRKRGWVTKNITR